MRFSLPKDYTFTFFSDRQGGSFKALSTQEGSYVFPEMPFSIADKTAVLQKAGFRRYVVDFSKTKVDRQEYRAVMDSLRKGTALEGVSRFNWKDGFYDPDRIEEYRQMNERASERSSAALKAKGYRGKGGDSAASGPGRGGRKCAGKPASGGARERRRQSARFQCRQRAQTGAFRENRAVRQAGTVGKSPAGRKAGIGRPIRRTEKTRLRTCMNAVRRETAGRLFFCEIGSGRLARKKKVYERDATTAAEREAVSPGRV